MPYDPVTGKYKKEDTGVATRITGLLNKDNPYMQQAATRGKQQANRRGLLNSTMGVQAVESARIGAALPIASQEAAQAHQSNLTGRNIEFQDVAQQRDISSRERMQGADIEAQNDRLAQELGSREALHAAQIAADRERLGMQLTSQEQIALSNLQAAQERLGIQIESQETLAGLDRDLRERLAQMDLSSGDLRAAASLAQGYEAAYSNMIAGIMANPEIPAAERQRYMDHAAAIRDSNLNLLEQLFNVDLQWSGGGTTPGNVPAIMGNYQIPLGGQNV